MTALAALSVLPTMAQEVKSPSFDEVLTSRRSIRNYDATTTISEEEVRTLLAAVWSLAVVHSPALADLLVVLLLAGLHDKLDVYDLCLADFPIPHVIQWATAALAVGRLILNNPVRCADRMQGAPSMPGLSATGLPARLAQRLRPAEFAGRNALLGRRDATVAAVLLRLSRCT